MSSPAHGHGHHHGSGGAPTVEPSSRVRRWVGGLALAITLTSGLGVAALWPTGPLPPSDAKVAPTYGASVVRATVASVRRRTCTGGDADRLPDGTIPARAACPQARVVLTSGPEDGDRRTVAVPEQVRRAGLHAGDRIDLARYPASAGVGTTYAWVDFDRRIPLLVVVGLFAAVVVLVGRARGLAALAGLVLAYGAVLLFVVPALLRGESAVLVSLTGSVAIMSVILYLAHGVSLKTATAHLGTTLGLLLTAVLAPAVAAWAHLRGLDDADSTVLAQLTGSSHLAGFVVAGVVIAGLGVLNDVTISQASAVWELRAADPGAGYALLVRRALRIGRDHLASTVYTLAFAYAGAALPTLVLLRLYALPLGQVLTSSAIAEEIVRTAVGGACLVLAIPVTTAVAAAAVATASPAASRAGGVSARSGGHGHGRRRARTGR